MTGNRIVAVWCPDWPVVAAGIAEKVSSAVPSIVVDQKRVVVCSALARRTGTRRGMRQREAQSSCPDLRVFDKDEDRDARVFEPVAAAVENLVAGVEVVRPGIVAAPVKGATRYFGSEETVVRQLIEQVTAAATVECQVGVADTLFAATIAARYHRVVPAGASAKFLAPLPLSLLDQPGSGLDELVAVLVRLGLSTMGSFAELSVRSVTDRFGALGVQAHRLARGVEPRPINRRHPTMDLSVTETFDPVLDRVDTTAFAGAALARRLHDNLTSAGLACMTLSIEATTETGEQRARTWSSVQPLSATEVAARVRWQCDGWLHHRDAPQGGIRCLTLRPTETAAGTALQQGLWRSTSWGHTVFHDDAESERAARAFARIQGILGPESVLSPTLRGGHDPVERVHFEEWGRKPAEVETSAPWPGQLPTPSPSIVYANPISVDLYDRQGKLITVSAQSILSAMPHTLLVNDQHYSVRDWAGPWLLDSRWWRRHARYARLHLTADHSERPAIAALVHARIGQHPEWTVRGLYD